jgi:signal transduction histidine kinase
MEERMQLVGGTLAITPVEPHGTRITATIPIDTTTTSLASASDTRRTVKTP